MTNQARDMLRARLAETRRRLGPFTAPANYEPFRVCDAELARLLVEVLSVLDVVVEGLGKDSGKI